MKNYLPSVASACVIVAFIGSTLLWISSQIFYPYKEGQKISLEVAGGKEDRAEINKRIDKTNEELKKVNDKVQDIRTDQRIQGKDIKSILEVLRNGRNATR